jgi:hypothetical protein
MINSKSLMIRRQTLTLNQSLGGDAHNPPGPVCSGQGESFIRPGLE